jgi:hypothetical protein
MAILQPKTFRILYLHHNFFYTYGTFGILYQILYLHHNFFYTYGTFGNFVSGVKKESSKEITTSSSSIFGFEISKWFGENKGRDGKGP